MPFHCIAHGIDMEQGLSQQKLAVDSGYWPLLRFDPRRGASGGSPLQLDSKPPKIGFKEYAYREARYRMLASAHPDEARKLLELAEGDIQATWRRLHAMSSRDSMRSPRRRRASSLASMPSAASSRSWIRATSPRCFPTRSPEPRKPCAPWRSRASRRSPTRPAATRSSRR